MNDYKELIGDLKKEFDNCDDLISQKIALNLTMASDRKYAVLAEDCCGEIVGIMQTISCAINAIEQLMHERFLIGEILVTASKWEIEPETALEQIRRVLRGE